MNNEKASIYLLAFFVFNECKESSCQYKISPAGRDDKIKPRDFSLFIILCVLLSVA